MIALTNKKIIFVTPPKCCSTTLHKHFCKDQENIYIIGPQFDNRNGRKAIDKHTYAIPFEFSKFEKFIFVRNPYSRAISLFNHYIIYNEIIDIDTFIIEVLIPSISDISLYSPISEYSNYNCYDNFIQIEFLNQCLINLGLNPPTIKENVSPNNNIILSDYHKKLIQIWAKEDFKNYLYNS